MPSPVGPTIVPTSLSRRAGTAHSAFLVSGLQDGSWRTPMCMHLHMPTCTDKDADLSRVEDEWDRPRLALVLDSLPEAGSQ